MSEKILKVLKIIGIVFCICLAISPVLILLVVLRNFNKTVKFYPTFEIVDITNVAIIDVDALKSGLDKAKAVMKL